MDFVKRKAKQYWTAHKVEVVIIAVAIVAVIIV